MKITIHERDMRNRDREHTMLNVDNVSCVNFVEDKLRIDFELYFAEDGKKVCIRNKRPDGEMSMKPITNCWEVELSESS